MSIAVTFTLPPQALPPSGSVCTSATHCVALHTAAATLSLVAKLSSPSVRKTHPQYPKFPIHANLDIIREWSSCVYYAIVLLRYLS